MTLSADDLAYCPHCKQGTGIPLDRSGAGIHNCPHCSKRINIFVDEDVDCNYWYDVEKAE